VPRRAVRFFKNISLSDISGARISMPPGRNYRGMDLGKFEERDRRKRDFSAEVKGPRLAQLEADLEDILDVGSGL
jgi:hypothetical protein